jgi:hypothetical protein
MSVVTRLQLLRVMRQRPYAVECSTGSDSAPQAAIVGVAVGDDFHVVFDTLGTSRKAVNLRSRPSVAFVFGSLEGQDERTVQYEGTTDEPSGAERDRLVELYLSVFPDGRDRQAWPHLTYLRAAPRWIRYSDFNVVPPQIVELDAEAIRRLE